MGVLSKSYELKFVCILTILFIMLTIEILDQSNNLTRKASDNLYELPRIANYRHNDSRTSLLDEGIHHLKRAYVIGGKIFNFSTIIS